jgi:hypothetical protein
MKQFETSSFKLVLHDNLLKEFTVKTGIKLLPEDVRESLKLSEEFYPGGRYYVLFETEQDADISNEAKRLGASEEYRKHTAALALHSSNVLMTVTGNLFLKINRPKVPTRFFDNREKALSWLKDLMTVSTTESQF